MTTHSEPSQVIWEVGVLMLTLADALAARFNPINVRGEISGFTRAASGHCYFVLKDGQGQLRCALFRRQATLLSFYPKDGDLVEVQGNLDIYTAKGDLQLLASSVELVSGYGQLLARFIETKTKLEAVGLFDKARKRSLTLYPRSIGVITSLGAAALHDVVTTLKRRVPHIPINIFPASVQGAQAPNELLAALHSVQMHQQQSALPIDVVLLVRGGGSFEDLSAFNDERLAYLLASFSIPTVTGIGHETDFTIADFVADVRAPTPTAAAELCARPLQELHLELLALSQRLDQVMKKNSDKHAQRLDNYAFALAKPAQTILQQQFYLQRLEAHFLSKYYQKIEQNTFLLKAIEQKFDIGINHQLNEFSHRLMVNEHALQALNPKQVLERGYAWLSDANGMILSQVNAIEKGMHIKATLVDGEVDLQAL